MKDEMFDNCWLLPLNDFNIALFTNILLPKGSKLGEGLSGSDRVSKHDATTGDSCPTLAEVWLDACGRLGILQCLSWLSQHKVTC